MAAQGGNCTSHIGRIYNGMATTGSRIVSVYVWLQIQSTSSGPQPTADTKVFPRQQCAWYFINFWLYYSSENFFESLNILTTLAYPLHYFKTIVEEPLWYTESTRLGFHPSEHKATERVLNLNLATNICRYVVRHNRWAHKLLRAALGEFIQQLWSRWSRSFNGFSKWNLCAICKLGGVSRECQPAAVPLLLVRQVGRTA